MSAHDTTGHTRLQKATLLGSLTGHRVTVTVVETRTYPVYEMGQPTGERKKAQEKVVLDGVLELVPWSPRQWEVQGEAYTLAPSDRIVSVVDHGVR